MNKYEEFAMIVTKYLTEYLSGQKNLSRNTILSYRNTFSLLLVFMNHMKLIPPEKMEFNKLSAQCIQEFLVWLENERNCSMSTRNQRLAAIHSFIKYVMFVRPDLLHECHQILGINYKKVPQGIIHYLSEKQTKQLLAMPDISKAVGLRNAAMLSLLYDSAARVQEFIDLSKGDICISSDSATLTLTGKGRKTRQVPIMNNTAVLIDKYIKSDSRLRNGNTGEALFISHTGTRFTRPGITYVLKKFGSLAWKEDEPGFSVTPHILRHSKGVHMLHAGINIYYIKEFLGHSDISTTERYYVKADTEMKRKALQKMQDEIIPEETSDLPIWKKDSDLLSWLKSLG